MSNSIKIWIKDDNENTPSKCTIAFIKVNSCLLEWNDNDTTNAPADSKKTHFWVLHNIKKNKGDISIVNITFIIIYYYLS